MIEDAASNGIAGGATYDLHVLACAHEATALATFNRRDYERFDMDAIELLAM